MPPTSETLIAAALEAGTITYEESLRQRAFALYNDSRLEPRFRSTIVDWEAGRSLFAEVDQKEEALDKALLADLAPFRARPNDPISVFNRPQSGKSKMGARGADKAGRIRRVATAIQAQSGCTFIKKLAEDWESDLVPGTNVRAWIPKLFKSQLGYYMDMVGKVWRAFPSYFTHPLPDDGNPCDETNPDSAVDVYFVVGSTIDPRGECRTLFSDAACTTGSMEAGGVARHTSSNIPSRYSGYAMVDMDPPGDPRLLNTIAHELAHISQFSYDAFESIWLHESTATWVAYKVVKALEKIPQPQYGYLTIPYTRSLLPIFPYLHNSLRSASFRYGAWLFFYSASIDLGDNIVTDVWEKARRPGPNNIYAVDEAIPLDEHFPRYTVRNWNRELVPEQWPYKNRIRDKTFPAEPKPKPVNIKFRGPGTMELKKPVMPLAARYYAFTFVDAIRKVTFRNLAIDNPQAHVWAIKEIGGQWKEPEDWTNETAKVLCRDIPEENVTKLVLVMSNSHILDPLPPHPLPRVVADGVGCELVHGWAKATLRIKDDIQDVTYASSLVNLRFKPWDSEFQDVEGNTQYDLMPTAVTWTANGVDVNGCRIYGQFLVTIPQTERNKPPDPTLPAYGYLSIKGIGNSDSHGVIVAATDPGAYFNKKCPNSPEIIKHFWPGTNLLNIPWEANSYDGDKVVYKGKKEFDLGKTYDFMKLLPPGTQLPQIALDALAQTSNATGTHLYTWEWKLEPAAGSGQAGASTGQGGSPSTR